MKMTFPCYITIDDIDAVMAKQKLVNMLRSERLLPLSFTVGNPIPFRIYEDKTSSDPSKRK